MKKIILTLLVTVMVFTMTIGSVLADAENSRVCLGADITQTEKETILEFFEVKEGDVKMLTLTNEEEHTILDGKVPSSKIGTKAYSCVFVSIKDSGGLVVETDNINWVTSDMYIAALATAGIENASVRITAPKPVSGTAALAGIYKSYEDITGVAITDETKDVATDELVLTAELGDALGQLDSVALINELKQNLEKTKSMTDEELRNYIIEIAKQFEIDLSADQVTQILDFIRKLANSDIDVTKLAGQLDSLKKNIDSLSKVGGDVNGFFESIGKFFNDIFSWVANIFK